MATPARRKADLVDVTNKDLLGGFTAPKLRTASTLSGRTGAAQSAAVPEATESAPVLAAVGKEPEKEEKAEETKQPEIAHEP